MRAQRAACRGSRPAAAPPGCVMSAPMRRSGAATRSIGRRISEASPISVRVEALRREQSHEQAHRRAGIAHVERRARRRQPATPRAVHAHLACSRPLDAHAERLQRAQRRQAVLAGEKARDLGLALGDAAEHQRAMRDRLVAGHRELAGDLAARLHPIACACARCRHGRHSTALRADRSRARETARSGV